MDNNSFSFEERVKKAVNEYNEKRGGMPGHAEIKKIDKSYNSAKIVRKGNTAGASFYASLYKYSLGVKNHYTESRVFAVRGLKTEKFEEETTVEYTGLAYDMHG